MKMNFREKIEISRAVGKGEDVVFASKQELSGSDRKSVV